MLIHAPFSGGFGAHFSQKLSLIVLTPKRTVLGRNHVIWAIKHEYWPRGSSWACEEEKKNSTGQDRKKVTKGLYFTYLTEAIYIKNCVVSDILDVITCAKFQTGIFRGYDFTGGRNFHFPIWFLNGPYNSAALLRCLWFRSNLTKNFNFGGPTPLSLHRWWWNLALRAKFHPHRCNVSPLRAKNLKIGL